MWSEAGADTYIPSGEPLELALARTTHLAVGAHQDDLEIMAVAGIIDCHSRAVPGFTGVIATNGSGSARSGPFSSFSDEEMRRLRRKEQRSAADVGRYAVLVQLDHPSSQVKAPAERAALLSDLERLFSLTRPRVVYTHSLFDAHATHRAVALAVIEVLRALPLERRPSVLVGCEVWQDLDWLPPEFKVAMDVSAEPNLQERLLAIFQSQIAGGKRYDLAALGRRRAHATFQHSHVVDRATGLVYAMDLMPLILDPGLSPATYVSSVCERHRERSLANLESLLTDPNPEPS